MDTHRRYWNQQQQIFRQSLMSKSDHQATIRLFLNQHAMLHSAEMSHSGLWSFEDEVLEGLTEAQMRSRPDGSTNSIAWLIWHIARIEDVTMNLLVAACPQVLDEADWVQRLHLNRRDVGTSMSENEVADFSNQVDCNALRAYRAAVGDRTRAIVSSLQPAELWERIDPTNIHRLTKEGALAEAAYELAQVWSGWKKAGMLTMPATRHSFTHLNEAYGVRRKLVK
ncbi:MAG TPA: DinB family protein [Ktedonobacteraceae bacterium]|nr:DinB family protein [Ktedonobacteraceae bacterium]